MTKNGGNLPFPAPSDEIFTKLSSIAGHTPAVRDAAKRSGWKKQGAPRTAPREWGDSVSDRNPF